MFFQAASKALHANLPLISFIPTLQPLNYPPALGIPDPFSGFVPPHAAETLGGAHEPAPVFPQDEFVGNSFLQQAPALAAFQRIRLEGALLEMLRAQALVFGGGLHVPAHVLDPLPQEGFVL